MNIPSEISSHSRVPHGGPFSTRHEKILDFSSNISPIGPPPGVKKYLKNNLDSIKTYPDPDSRSTRKNLRQYTGIPESQITVGNGATEIIYNFCHAFLQKRPVLIPIPTFGEYEAASKLYGAKISFFKTMNLNDNLDIFVKQIPKDGCVFLCNPNNPTGVLTKKNDIKRIVASAAEKSSLVFVDECFIELVPRSDESVSGLIRQYPNLLVLRSLTKSFGLAGVRVGYAMGSKEMIDILNKIKIPWNISGPAQRAADIALHHTSYIDKAKKTIKKESEFLQSKISEINGFEYHDASANFILIKTRHRAKTIQKKLLKYDILVRDCSSFRGLDGNYIRIAVRTRDENRQLIKAMKKI